MELGSRDRLLAFCEAVQRSSPVSSFTRPVAGITPGYASEVPIFIRIWFDKLPEDGLLNAPLMGLTPKGLFRCLVVWRYVRKINYANWFISTWTDSLGDICWWNIHWWEYKWAFMWWTSERAICCILSGISSSLASHYDLISASPASVGGYDLRGCLNTIVLLSMHVQGGTHWSQWGLVLGEVLRSIWPYF